MSLVIDVLANRAATASPGDAFSAKDTGQDFVWTTQWDEVPSTLLSRTWYSAKGMILAGSAASAPTGLAIAGTTGYVLSVDPAEVTGMKWISPPGGAGILTTTYKAATQAFSSTVLTNVTSMNFACASTTLYHYKFLPIIKSGTATVGVKFTVTWPTSTISVGRVSMPVTASGTTAYFHGNIATSGTVVTGTSVVAAGTIAVVIVEGIVRATAAGSIQLQAAAEAAGTVWVMDYSVGLLYTIS